MPELPEVETIKNDLRDQLVGCTFTSVWLLWPGMVLQPGAEELKSRLVGQKVMEVGRRGKYLILHLSGGEALVIHLRMSGALLLRASPTPPDGHTRAIFGLDNGQELHFWDRRKLGTMALVADENQLTARLGPEPLEESFTPEVLAGVLKRHKAPLKVVLLDQMAIAGIGNMYADEALFAARIHPLRPANKLSGDEMEHLHRAIRQVLLAGIKGRGASVDTYRDAAGEEGTAHLQFKVAHRGGQPCPVCGVSIQRLPLRGRGTYFCPRCQAEPAEI